MPTTRNHEQNGGTRRDAGALVPITTAMISGATVQAVDARELHTFLEVRRDFSNWIKARIEKYGFQEGADYLLTNFGERQNQALGAIQGRIEYSLSLDMAKELSMVENNDPGKQARRYFIECENKAKAPPPLQALPSPLQDRVSAYLLLGQAVGAVPGVKPGIAMAAALDAVRVETGMNVESLRRALPPAEDVPTLNATQIGEELGITAAAANLQLHDAGLQKKDGKVWTLTKAGEKFGESLPFTRHGHSGYQILWFPAVLDALRAKVAA
jgi:phage anti-repressor protein